MENLNVKVSAEVQDLTKGLDQAEARMTKFGNQTTVLANKTGQLTKSTTNAVPALTSFSQVIQDAPYGIRGVANNITQLTSQFGYLSKAAGGPTAALKAMIGSLTGPAGILFAVSAVTSLLVSFGDKLFDNTKKVDDNEAAQTRLNKALALQRDLRKQLNSELDIASEIAAAEAKLAGKTEAEQYQAAKQFRQANIALLQGQLQESERLYKEYDARVKATRGKGFDEAVQLRDQAYKNVIETEQKLNESKARLYLADLKEQLRIQGESEKATVTHYANLATGIQNAAQNLTPVLDDIRAKFQIIKPEDLKAQLQTLTDGEIAIMAALSEFNTKADEIIRGGIVDTFGGLAEAIGGALGAGDNVIKSVGASLLSSLGGVLVDLGKLALSVGIGLAAIKKALQSLNPAAAIAAGIGLIALGSFFKGAASKIGNSMGSGSSGYSSSSTGGGTSSYGNYSSNQSYAGNSYGGTVVFEIAGTKLVGVLSNTLSKNKALGGNLSLN